jgi:hypothetical protein
MKFQNVIRVQLMMLGLGAGLLLAKPVYAQQETDPTLFEATSDASQQAQDGFNVPAPPQAMNVAVAESATSAVVQTADIAAWSSMDMNTIVALMVGIGSIVLMGIGEAMRGNRGRIRRVRSSNRFPRGAIAN